MKILFLNPMNDYWVDLIEKMRDDYPEHEFVIRDKSLCSEDLADSEGIVASSLTDKDLNLCKNLKIVFIHYAGANLFPLPELKKRGIAVSNVHSNAPYVAEHCLRMILVLLGKTIEFHTDLSSNIWHGWASGNGASDSWSTLYNRKVSILGTGSIGTFLAGHLSLFDCSITGFRKHPGKEASPDFSRITSDFDSALDMSEIIINTLPMTSETCDLINEKNIRLLSGRYFINAGRAEIINEKLLFTSLKEGLLKGAALDVWYNYPGEKNINASPADYPFGSLKNVVLSPHVAGFNPETVKKSAEDTIANIKSYLENRKPVFTVNHDDGY
ncbi:MAG: hydroxyacid dehydrogenase [Spirochaetes bacterium]|nr:hydroxyacid dehydrogenase [Spirochaetota bacterium]